MARLIKGFPPEFRTMKSDEYGINRFSEDWKENYRLQDEAMIKLQKRTTVFKHQMADSYAYYAVVKMAPLTLQWVPYMDQWEAPDYVIRGLRADDIRQQERWDRAFKKAVAEQQESEKTNG